VASFERLQPLISISGPSSLKLARGADEVWSEAVTKRHGDEVWTEGVVSKPKRSSDEVWAL
jgi:hypothetical protein